MRSKRLNPSPDYIKDRPDILLLDQDYKLIKDQPWNIYKGCRVEKMAIDMSKSFRHVLRKHGKDNTFFLRIEEGELSKYVVAMSITHTLSGTSLSSYYLLPGGGVFSLLVSKVDTTMEVDEAIQLAAIDCFKHLSNVIVTLGILNLSRSLL